MGADNLGVAVASVRGELTEVTSATCTKLCRLVNRQRPEIVTYVLVMEEHARYCLITVEEEDERWRLVDQSHTAMH